METILPIIKQVMPIASIVAISNVGAFIYIKMKNNKDRIEIMDVSRKLKKIDKINKANKESIF